MNFFLTGGTGFLGSNVLQGLIDSKYEVYVLTRNETKLANLNGGNVHIVHGDLSNIKDVDCPDFDICLHFAWGGVNRNGVTDAEVQKNSYENTCQLLSFCEEHKCSTFIDAGSRQEYIPTNEIITENTTCAPVSEYGKWKLKANEYAKHFCQESDIQYIHLRIFSVYGFGDHPWSLISTLIEKLSNNEDVQLGECKQHWSFLHISDFVQSILCVIEKRQSLSDYEVFNIASDDIRELRDFVVSVKDILNSKGELMFGSFRQNRESVMSLKPSIKRAETKLGWSAKKSFKDGIINIVKRQAQ